MVVILRAIKESIISSVVGVSSTNFFLGVLPDEPDVISMYVISSFGKRVVEKPLIRILVKNINGMEALDKASRIKDFLLDNVIAGVVVKDMSDTDVKCPTIFIISVTGPSFLGVDKDRNHTYSIEIEVSTIK